MDRKRAKKQKEVVVLRPTPGKKITVIIVIALLLLFAVSAIAYFYLYPRTDLSIKTVYHERMGGGSTGGGININILFTNSGTTQIKGLTYVLNVLNQTDVHIKSLTDVVTLIEPGDDTEIATSFIGNHFDTYYISLTINFQSDGGTYSADFSYKTTEDAMNIIFQSHMS
jgi:hypothetical protein